MNDPFINGFIGPYVINSIVAANAVSLTSGSNPKTVTTIVLTPGIWQISGAVGFDPTGTTDVDVTYGAFSLANDTAPAVANNSVPSAAGEIGLAVGFQSGSVGNNFSICLPPVRAIVTAVTTYYLIGRATWSTGTMGAYGSIFARMIAPLV